MIPNVRQSDRLRTYFPPHVYCIITTREFNRGGFRRPCHFTDTRPLRESTGVHACPNSNAPLSRCRFSVQYCATPDDLRSKYTCQYTCHPTNRCHMYRCPFQIFKNSTFTNHLISSHLITPCAVTSGTVLYHTCTVHRSGIIYDPLHNCNANHSNGVYAR